MLFTHLFQIQYPRRHIYKIRLIFLQKKSSCIKVFSFYLLYPLFERDNRLKKGRECTMVSNDLKGIIEVIPLTWQQNNTKPETQIFILKF